MKWVLIIMLHGWGAGVGSTGNAITSVDFSSKESCEIAARKVVETGPRETQTICVEK